MPDAAIVVPDTTAAPKDYTLTGAQEIVLKSVRAVVDGSGAGSTYLPALQLLDPNGNVMWEGTTLTTVAAAGSADVSWFPRVGGSSSGPSPSTSELAVCALYSGSARTVTTAAGLTYVSIQDGIASAGFGSTDSAVFTNGSTTLFTGSAVYGVQINAPGTYRVVNNSFTNSRNGAVTAIAAYWAASDGSAPSFLQTGRTKAASPETWDSGQVGVGPHLFTEEWMTVTAGQTPAVLCRWVTVTGGTSADVYLQMNVEQLTTNVLTKL